MRKILVVDDSEVNLFLIQTIYEGNPDIVVEIESNSSLALLRLQEGHYDLLLLDLMMPNVDGFELLAKIKSDASLNDIPIIVITAKQDIDTEKHVMNYGVQGYVKKPIRLNEIEEMINHIFLTSQKQF